jgi:hypothetical protein
MDLFSFILGNAIHDIINGVLAKAASVPFPPHIGFPLDDLQREISSSDRKRGKPESVWGLICRFLRQHLATINMLLYRTSMRWLRCCITLVDHERLGSLLAQNLKRLTQEYYLTVNRYEGLALEDQELSVKLEGRYPKKIQYPVIDLGAILCPFAVCIYRIH